MSGRRPWEETWIARDDYGSVRVENEAGQLVLYGEPTSEGNHDLCGAPAAITLAAAAPELYRALRRCLQYGGLYDWGAVMSALDNARGGEPE